MNKALLRMIWVVVAIVVLIGLIRVIATRDHRSADQKILIEKSKQRNF